METPAEKTARLASIPDTDLDWLITDSLPRSIAYEGRLLLAAESRLNEPPHGPESIRDVLATRQRTLRRLNAELSELQAEHRRRGVNGT